LALGVEHPDRLTLTSKQLAEWFAVWRIDPWGEERRDAGLAQIAALLFNANRAKGTQPKGIEEFMLYHRKAEKTPGELKMILEGAIRAANRPPKH
jgi:hypothetical protein